jgi:predicted O-methyltransferase YrrM
MTWISDICQRYKRVGYGSITGGEAAFIESLISEHRPKNFIEIGTASGFSAGMILHFMGDHGGESLTTLDLKNRFFAEMDKPVGFLIDEICPCSSVSCLRMPLSSSLDITPLGKSYQMAFVDADHRHPWPMLDTLLHYTKGINY